MANKKCIALTEEQYYDLIDVIEGGFLEHRPNKRIAAALKVEANLGLRINDVLNLHLDDIVYEAGRYHLDIVEQKTGKKRTFTVPLEVVEFLRKYCKEEGIHDNERIFTFTERYIQKFLKFAADYLEMADVSTHSFRKFFATSIYLENDYNIVLVQTLLQHSSPVITQRYIGIGSKELEEALNKHVRL